MKVFLIFFQPLSLEREFRGVFPIWLAPHRGFLFVHSSQQREERTKKRRRCYRAYSLGRYCRRRGLRNSLRSDSPRPGSSAGRRPPGPIKAVFPIGHACCYFLNPSPRDGVPRFLPYIAGATQRRSLKCFHVQYFSIPLRGEDSLKGVKR